MSQDFQMSKRLKNLAPQASDVSSIWRFNTQASRDSELSSGWNQSNARTQTSPDPNNNRVKCSLKRWLTSPLPCRSKLEGGKREAVTAGMTSHHINEIIIIIISSRCRYVSLRCYICWQWRSIQPASQPSQSVETYDPFSPIRRSSHTIPTAIYVKY